MRIKLKKLYSDPEVFNPIIFQDGVNLIIGEKVNDSIKRGKKTNGVGKSLSVEFINFCLLKNDTDSRVMRIPEDKISGDTKIILNLEINSKELTIIRTKNKSKTPTIIENGKETEFNNIDDATKYLEGFLFENNSSISFRELLGPIIRDEESGFKNISIFYDIKKRIPPCIKPNAFFFGIDINLIRKIEKQLKDIKQLNEYKNKLKLFLTENKTKKISDIKSSINSLSADLKKMDLALDSFKSNEAYSIYEDDLSKEQVEIDDLRSKYTALKYELNKMNSLPSIENIKNEEIKLVFNHFKNGLGDIVKKNIDDVIEFKKKIDEFERRIFSEKIVEIKTEMDNLSSKIKVLENSRLEKIKMIDKKNVLKDLKNSYKIFQNKKDRYNNISSKYSEYLEKETDLKNLKFEKDKNFIELDRLIENIQFVIDSFNKTILEIHEFIMDSSEASFEIRTINNLNSKQILDFVMRIEDDGSHSVDRTKVFIYDIALLFNEYTSKNHPKLLIHDNIFDVDRDTLLKSLNYLSQQENSDFQYILTLNRDKIEEEERSGVLKLDINSHSVANFTKLNKFLRGKRYSQI